MSGRGGWRPSPAIVLSVIAVVLAMSGFTLAATKHAGGGKIHACVVKRGPGKGLLRVVNRPACPRGTRSLVFNQEGPAGPRGAPGSTGATGPQGPGGIVPPLEAVHYVGASGQPNFEEESENSSPTDFRAGFYKDRSGIVHLQGMVNASIGQDIFRLPQGFRPVDQVCFSVPGFFEPVSDRVFATNRLCILEGEGEVRNSDGQAVEFINLDGIEFRPE